MPKAEISTFFDDECTASRVVDMSVKDDRSWLYSHITWAINNGRVVEIEPHGSETQR